MKKTLFLIRYKYWIVDGTLSSDANIKDAYVVVDGENPTLKKAVDILRGCRGDEIEICAVVSYGNVYDKDTIRVQPARV